MADISREQLLNSLDSKDASPKFNGYVAPSVEEQREATPDMSEESMQKLIEATAWEPDAGAYWKALGAGAARGAGEGGTFMGGALAATRTAAPVLNVIPHPVARGVGYAVTGLAGGLTATFGLADMWDEMFPKPEDPTLDPYFEGARTLGGGLTSGVGAFAFKPLTANMSRFERMIATMGENARANKGKYLAKELLANTWVGVAGGTAVQLAPDSPFARFGTEIAASVVNPFARLYDANMMVKGAKQSLEKQGYSPRVQTQVTNAITEVLENQGENPADLAVKLQKAIQLQLQRGGDASSLPTPAQLVSSPTLSGLERRLATVSEEFGHDTKLRAEQGFQVIHGLTEGLIKSGDPEALALAARLMEEDYAKQFVMAIQSAEAKAMDAAQKLGPKGVEDKTKLAAILQENVEEVFRLARDTESDLWDTATRAAFRYNKDMELAPVKTRANNLARAFLELTDGAKGATDTRINNTFGSAKTEITNKVFNKLKDARAAYKNGVLTEEYQEAFHMPDAIMRKMDMKQTSVTDLIKMRSQFLADARVAAGAQDMDAARVYNGLAQAALKDIEKIKNPAYARATAFSKQLNDVFTRTFAGEMDDVTRTGQARYAPETLIKRMFAGGLDSSYKRNREILIAVNALEIPDVGAAGNVLEAQQRILRAVAGQQTMKPTTVPGKPLSIAEIEAGGVAPSRVENLVDPAKLQKFREDNADLIKMMGMEEEFSDINKASLALMEVTDQGSAFNKMLRGQKSLSKLLDGQDPARVVSDAISSKNPLKEFNTLAKLAKDNGPESVEGLKSAVYQHAFGKAELGSLKDGSYFTKLDEALFRPLSANRPSVARMLADNGMLTLTEVKNLRKNIINPAKRIEEAIAKGERIPDDALHMGPGDIVSDLDRLLIAHISAKAAAAISPGGPGSLSFSQRVIGVGEKFFDRMPGIQRERLMMEAVKDPELMLQMLKTGKKDLEKRSFRLNLLGRLYSPQASKVNAFRILTQDSLEGDDQPNAEPIEPEVTSPPQARRMLQNLPTVNTRGLPKPGGQQPAPQQTAQAPAAPQGGSPNQSSREMLQKLFPMDQVLG